MVVNKSVSGDNEAVYLHICGLERETYKNIKASANVWQERRDMCYSVYFISLSTL